MKLVWTTPASQERDNIYDYIEKDNPLAAIDIDDLFGKKAKSLIDFPEIGKPGRIEGTREYAVHESYLLIYEIIGDTI